MNTTPFAPQQAAPTAPPAVPPKKWFGGKLSGGQLAFVAGVLLTFICLEGPKAFLQLLVWIKAPQTAGDLAAAAPGSRAAAAAIPAFRGIPNLSVSYYDIRATDAAGIEEELRTSRIRWGRRRFRALTSWHYDWEWKGKPGGGCGTAGAQVNFNAKVTLPRLANPGAVSPAVARAWTSYMDALTRHEANHARIAWRGHKLVTDVVRSSGCTSANAAGQLAIANINYVSELYDERTRHGASEGATFRPPSGE